MNWKKILLVYALLLIYTVGPNLLTFLMNQTSLYMACSAGDVAGCNPTVHDGYLGRVLSPATVSTGTLALTVYSVVIFIGALSRWLDYKMRYNAPRK